MTLSELQTAWDTWYNSPLIQNPTLDYLVVSVLRILVAYAAWQMLRALYRYSRTALPPPHTPANLAYWLRWWVWLRLREHRALKLGTLIVVVSLLAHIPGGPSGLLNDTSPHSLLLSAGLILLLIGMARFLHGLTKRIEHPEVPHD